MAQTKKVRDEIEAWFKANQDKLIVPGDAEKTKPSGSFKGPEGFSNIIGVGANPVLTAIEAQLEEQRKQTAYLQQMANASSYTPPDFTKTGTGNPHIDGYNGQM